jgi:hypothetical protein
VEPWARNLGYLSGSEPEKLAPSGGERHVGRSGGQFDVRRDAIQFPCGKEVTLLAIVAHEAGKEPPDATLAEATAYLTQDNYGGQYSVMQRLMRRQPALRRRSP